MHIELRYCIINVDQAIKFKIEIYSDHRSQVMPGSAMIAAKKIALPAADVNSDVLSDTDSENYRPYF